MPLRPAEFIITLCSLIYYDTSDHKATLNATWSETLEEVKERVIILPHCAEFNLAIQCSFITIHVLTCSSH